jgi:hypothetical protein
VLGRFRYSDLKEAAPGGLWDLYLDESVLMVCECDVAVGVLGFQQQVAERMGVGGHRRVRTAPPYRHSDKCET